MAGQVSGRHRILVTGIGALIGQGVVQGLRSGGRSWTLGVDRRRSLYAQLLCDETVLKPAVNETSDEYLAFWTDVVRKHRIEMIIPGISIDMAFLDAHRGFFEGLGVRLALNTSHLISLTEDKIAFEADYAGLGLPVIPSVHDGSWDEAIEALGPGPLLLKPAVGEGSVGIARLQDQTDFDYWTRKTPGPYLVQRIVGTDDEEYTVGAFGLGDGGYLGPLIMRRLLTRAGNTGMAETVDHPLIAEATDTILRHYKPLGPTNLQFRVDGDKAYLLEINPRFSSSCSIRTAFGFNEPEMCIDFYIKNQCPPQPRVRQGLAQRHQADSIELCSD